MSASHIAGRSTNASQTIQAEVVAQPEPAQTLVLQLRERPQITWAEDTIDNEHMGKKSSKRCCIFHKVKKFAESDSDETSEEEGDGNNVNKNEKGEGGEGAVSAAGKPKKVKNYQRHHA